MTVIRVLSILMAYAYHGIGGLVLLTWVLLSFVVPTITFVNSTIKYFIPIYVTLFLYLYFINVRGLLPLYSDFTNQPYQPKKYGIRFDQGPQEVALISVTLLFLILLIPSRYILKMQRDDTKHTLFKTMADKKSNFLWQFLFYVLKRLHIIVLGLLFFLGMEEISLYFVGLMFFFVMFTASTNDYRKYGNVLVYYAGFFIWIE